MPVVQVRSIGRDLTGKEAVFVRRFRSTRKPVSPSQRQIGGGEFPGNGAVVTEMRSVRMPATHTRSASKADVRVHQAMKTTLFVENKRVSQRRTGLLSQSSRVSSVRRVATDRYAIATRFSLRPLRKATTQLPEKQSLPASDKTTLRQHTRCSRSSYTPVAE